MIVVVEALVVLGALEVGQHASIVPPGAAVLTGPEVVVGGIAAGIELRVDGGAATDHLGLGEAQDADVHVLLRDGGPAPTGDALGHLGEARRHLEQRVPVAAPRFEQQHLDGRVIAQAIGEDAAGRAGAGDDVVVAHGVAVSAESAAAPSSVRVMWSATRSACAAMVSAGVTAAELGRKPASTT